MSLSRQADATQTDASINEEAMGRSRYTEAQIAAVLELRRAGHNAQYIGLTLNIPISTVYTMCRRAGFGGNGRGRKRSTHYDHDKIAGLRQQGLSTRAIAEQVGCSHATVNAVLHSRGLAKIKAQSASAGDFAPELVARVVRRYAEGASLEDLGVEETLRSKTIRRILRAAGVQIRGGGGGDRRFVGRATLRWRLVWNADDDEQWRHFETGETVTLTDRGLEARDKRFIVLEPEMSGHFATRDEALEAVEARKP